MFPNREGQRVPQVTFRARGESDWKSLTTDEVFKGKTVVAFSLPGAFTPTCSSQHVPGYLKHHDALKAKGVDTIVCMAVNDGYVMGAWGASQNVGDKIRMLGDGSAAFTKALGLELDLTAKGMGVRCQRFSLLVDNGVVKQVNVEGVGPANCSFAENMLTQLG